MELFEHIRLEHAAGETIALWVRDSLPPNSASPIPHLTNPDTRSGAPSGLRVRIVIRRARVRATRRVGIVIPIPVAIR